MNNLINFMLRKIKKTLPICGGIRNYWDCSYDEAQQKLVLSNYFWVVEFAKFRFEVVISGDTLEVEIAEEEIFDEVEEHTANRILNNYLKELMWVWYIDL